MNTARSMGKMLSIASLALSLLLIGVMYSEWQWGEDFRLAILKAPVSAAKMPPAALLPEFGLPPRESAYRETLARPLFMSSRYSTQTGRAGLQQMKKGQFILTGIIIVPGQRLAMLKDVASGKSERVEQGQEIRGMRAERVDAGVLVLKQGNETEELLLKIQRAPSAPVPEGSASAQPAPRPSGVASVTISETARPLDTSEQKLAAQDRERQKQLDQYRENNRQRAEKGMPLLIIPESLLQPVKRP